MLITAASGASEVNSSSLADGSRSDSSPAQFFHLLPVRGGPRGQVFRRGDEHPDRQLPRIVAVPQQLGPHHRAVREQPLHLMVKNPCHLFHIR